MKPICIKCGLFFEIIKNGVVVEEGRPATNEDKRGSGNWLPYKLYVADHWRCTGCGTELALAAYTPFSEHYMPDYQAEKERRKPIVFIRDC